MIKIYQQVNMKYDKVSETLNKNQQAKNNSDSQHPISPLVGIYILREERERESIEIKLSPCKNVT